METKKDTFNLHMSILLEPGLSDFDIAWQVNDATTKMDEFSRNFKSLEKPVKTWVTGHCYLDYDLENKIVPIESITNGNKKVFIGVTRKYSYQD